MPTLVRHLRGKVALPQHQPTWATGPAPRADSIFQCALTEYPTTQAWGTWFRSQCPDADGIEWISREFNRGRCIVLFSDRCESDLEQVGDSVELLAPGSVE